MKLSPKAMHTSIAVIMMLVGMLGGIACLATPEPVPTVDTTQFSAISASAWLKEISKKPRSVFDFDEHERVMRYLVNELEKLGAETSLMQFTAKNTEPENGGPEKIDITNIHAKLDGKSEDAILLISHYDSVYGWDFDKLLPTGGESYGAADDGYGVATTLEIIRAIKAGGKPLENDIRILMTDAEELGMLGMEKEMSQNLDAWRNVRLVISIEARGVKGPVIMFETGDKNAALMDFYIKNARMPLTYSFATDIYRISPITTDFTSMLRRGFTGYNFSVLDHLDVYHTKEDNFENIDLSSIQHYGEQILPMVKAFAYTPSDKLPSFRADQNNIFFNLLPGTVISYSRPVAIILLASAIVLYLLLIFAGIRNRGMLFGRVLCLSALYGAMMITFAISGTIAAFIMSILFNKLFYMTYLTNIPLAGFQQALWIVLAAAALIHAVRKFSRKQPHSLEPLLAGITINLLLSVASLIFLPGASFLFTLPALLALVYGSSAVLTESPACKTIAAGATVILTLVLYIPIVYLAYLALTFGSAGAITAISMTGLILLIPGLMHYLGEGCNN